MRSYIIKRLLLIIPTVIGVATLVFFMVVLAPGDPARVMLGERVSEERLEKLRSELGLDKPIGVQYLQYLRNLAKLDFSRSIVSGQSVADEIKKRLPATIELAICAIIFAVSVGIFLGVSSAVKRNTWIDYSTMVSALIGVSIPVFWLGLVLIMVFSVNLNLLPTGGRMNVRYYFEPITNFYILDGFIYLFRDANPKYLVSALKHIILPTIALGSIPLAIIARTTRSAMLEVLKKDYIKTVRAAGIKHSRIIYYYALRNALLPVITVIGLQFGALLAGAIMTETVFSWPGLGKWLYTSIGSRDYPAVQGGIIVISLMYIFINLSVDILYSLINPRIRLK